MCNVQKAIRRKVVDELRNLKPCRCRYTRIQDGNYHYDGKTNSTMMTLGTTVRHVAQKAFTLKSLMPDRETTVANKSRRQLSAVADTQIADSSGPTAFTFVSCDALLSLVFGYGITANPVTGSWSTWNAPPRTYSPFLFMRRPRLFLWKLSSMQPQGVTN